MKTRMHQFTCILTIIIMLLSACAAKPDITIDDNDESLVDTPYIEDSPDEQPDVEKSSAVLPNKDTPVIIISTGNPAYAKAALFDSSDIVVALTNTSATDKITEAYGTLFISPNGDTIVLYFENQIPVRAVIQGHLVQFSNIRDDLVDITVIAPDGTITKTSDVPFELDKILKGSQNSFTPSKNGGHLAKIYLADNSDVDLMDGVITALGVFSCAAVIATGGSLGILFGASCALSAYTIYLKATGQEVPVIIEGTGTAATAIKCGKGIGEKSPIAAADCGKLILNIADEVLPNANEIDNALKPVEEGSLPPSYTNLDDFKRALKSALETGDESIIRELIEDLGPNEFVFGAGAHGMGGQSMTHDEAIYTIMGWDLSKIVVDISNRGETIYKDLADPKPEFTGPIVLAEWTDGNNPMLLEIIYKNGRYYWGSFLSFIPKDKSTPSGGGCSITKTPDSCDLYDSCNMLQHLNRAVTQNNPASWECLSEGWEPVLTGSGGTTNAIALEFQDINEHILNSVAQTPICHGYFPFDVNDRYGPQYVAYFSAPRPDGEINVWNMIIGKMEKSFFDSEDIVGFDRFIGAWTFIDDGDFDYIMSSVKFSTYLQVGQKTPGWQDCN